MFVVVGFLLASLISAFWFRLPRSCSGLVFVSGVCFVSGLRLFRLAVWFRFCLFRVRFGFVVLWVVVSVSNRFLCVWCLFLLFVGSVVLCLGFPCCICASWVLGLVLFSLLCLIRVCVVSCLYFMA